MLHVFQVLIFVVGIVCLVKGADWLVGGASSLARRSGLTPIFIGLTVVAMGTSTPELVVSLTAAFKGNTNIALGNIVGSNIANILFILGISAILTPLSVKGNTVWKEIPFGILAMLLLVVMGSFSVIGRVDGVILLLFLGLFLYYTVSISKNSDGPVSTINTYSTSRSWLLILAGLGVLVLGGRFIVTSAVHFALVLGLSETVIGLTIVAIGTSLPELAASIAAINKGDNDLAIGNIVGSNILNVFFILGLTAVVSPLPVSGELLVDIVVAIAATLFLFVSMFIGNKLYVLDRKEGFLMLAAYGTYLAYLMLR